MSLRETILVVEDSTPNRSLLVKLLKKAGYHVLEAPDGLTAKKVLDSIGTQENCRLMAILSDIVMPQIDGLSLLKDIRHRENYRDLPFVFITSVSDRETILRAQDLRADGYLLKPITLGRIVKKLEQLFPGRSFVEGVGA